MPNTPSRPPKWLTVFAGFVQQIFDSAVWLVDFTAAIPSRVRRFIKYAACEHDYKIRWWSKGCSKIFYVEYCMYCDKPLPINNISLEIWEEMGLEKFARKSSMMFPPVR